MKASQILEEARAHGANPRLVDGIVVTNWIADRQLRSVVLDAMDPIAELLRREELEAKPVSARSER
jgi:hypothetical protein